MNKCQKHPEFHLKTPGHSCARCVVSDKLE